MWQAGGLDEFCEVTGTAVQTVCASLVALSRGSGKRNESLTSHC